MEIPISLAKAIELTHDSEEHLNEFMRNRYLFSGPDSGYQPVEVGISNLAKEDLQAFMHYASFAALNRVYEALKGSPLTRSEIASVSKRPVGYMELR